MGTRNPRTGDHADERAYEALARRTKEQLAEFGEATKDSVASAIDYANQLTIEEPIKYRTGEITGPGTLTCLNCDNELHFHDSGRIPPCGNCHGTDFRKSY